MTIQPYAQPEANAIYNLLFCDDLNLFRPKPGRTPTDWQTALFGTDANAVRRMAEDTDMESRVRVLAFNWLQGHGYEVPRKVLLGVIVEMPLDAGLDVIAAYGDARARYLNQSGKMVVIEDGLPELKPMVSRLMELSQPLVDRIGPWDKARLPPPAKPNVRLSFLVSDGLYFGQGPLQALGKDPAAAPIIGHAAKLVQTIVNAARSER
jgi:hypothetical protein